MNYAQKYALPCGRAKIGRQPYHINQLKYHPLPDGTDNPTQTFDEIAGRLASRIANDERAAGWLSEALAEKVIIEFESVTIDFGGRNPFVFDLEQ